VVDGLLVNSLADDDPVLQAAITRQFPLVVIDQPRPARLRRLAPGIPWVGVEDRRAAAEAAEHLLNLGHRRFGVVSFGLWRSPGRGLVDVAAQRNATYAVSRDRLAGYRDALERHGLNWDAVPVFHGTDSTPAEGEAGGMTILTRRPRPTAVLCLSDRLAEGLLRAVRHLGLRVPEDVSVVGFDDADPTAAALDLTTVRQPHRIKGERAAEALLDLLSGSGPATGSPPLGTELITRSSTCPPRRRHGAPTPG
jgi:DNA-binding LacI/PurR family transcriptional regulator